MLGDHRPRLLLRGQPGQRRPIGGHGVFAQVAAKIGTGSIDLTASADGKYVYVEAAAGGGSVFELRINSDGSLSPIGSVPGLGTALEGIAVG